MIGEGREGEEIERGCYEGDTGVGEIGEGKEGEVQKDEEEKLEKYEGE